MATNESAVGRFGRTPRPLPGVKFYSGAREGDIYMLPLLIEATNLMLAAPFLTVLERAAAQVVLLTRAKQVHTRFHGGGYDGATSPDEDFRRIREALVSGDLMNLWGWLDLKAYNAYWAR